LQGSITIPCSSHHDLFFANRPATLPIVAAVPFGSVVASVVLGLLALAMLVVDLGGPAEDLAGTFALTGF
jgi:hypothetical protein